MPPELIVSWVVSVGTPFVLERLKASQHPLAAFITPYTPVLNRVTAVVVSVLMALGVTCSYDAYTGTLMVTGLKLADVVQLALTALGNFFVQQMVYRARIDPRRT